MKMNISATFYDCVGEVSRLVALANAYADQNTIYAFTLNDTQICVSKTCDDVAETKVLYIPAYGCSEVGYLDVVAWLHAEIVKGLTHFLKDKKSTESAV